MRMGALEQFNSRYRDIDIGDSQEIRSALSQIPEELLSRATIAEHGTEMRTDRLVCQQSTAMDTSNEDFSTENAVEKSSDNPFAYPMSFFTRTSSSYGLSSREAALKGNIKQIAKNPATF